MSCATATAAAPAANTTSPQPASTTHCRRVFIITGSNTGVGFQTARQLALGAGATHERDAKHRHIILACRTPSKAEAAVQRIRQEVAETGACTSESEQPIVEWMQLDLTDYNSISNFAAAFNKRGLPLHVLINNAGVNQAPDVLPQPVRINSMWIANYMGPWLLTSLLLPVLEASAPSRIINVSSFMHRLGSVRDLEGQMRQPKQSRTTYSSTKLAQVFHAQELQRRYASKGVSVFITHPGACASDIWKTLQPVWLRHVVSVMLPALLTTEKGAMPSVLAATKPVGDGHSANERGAAKTVEHYGPYRTLGIISPLFTDWWQPSCCSRVSMSRTSPISYDEQKAKELWSLSEQLCREWEEASKAQ